MLMLLVLGKLRLRMLSLKGSSRVFNSRACVPLDLLFFSHVCSPLFVPLCLSDGIEFTITSHLVHCWNFLAILWPPIVTLLQQLEGSSDITLLLTAGCHLFLFLLFFLFGYSCGMWKFPSQWLKPLPQQWPKPQQWQHWALNPLCHQGTPNLAITWTAWLLIVPAVKVQASWLCTLYSSWPLASFLSSLLLLQGHLMLIQTCCVLWASFCLGTCFSWYLVCPAWLSLPHLPSGCFQLNLRIKFSFSCSKRPPRTLWLRVQRAPHPLSLLELFSVGNDAFPHSSPNQGASEGREHVLLFTVFLFLSTVSGSEEEVNQHWRKGKKSW